jgi:hypothetical protein
MGACSSSSSESSPPPPCDQRGKPPEVYDHVIWIVMENHTREQVIGTADGPYETYLSRACGMATDYRQVGSPSLPNYIGMTSGSTHGIHDDDDPAEHRIDSDNLFRQVRDSGRLAKTYAESMRTACAVESTDRYAPRHNPATYLAAPEDRAACARDDIPAGDLEDGAFIDALRGDELPAFSVLIPDLCHDTHDCPVATGDRWLRDWVGTIIESDVYAERMTAVFVVWDEESPMPFLAIAPTVDKGRVVTETVDHYSLLRTTEELLGIDERLGDAAAATSMRRPFGI